MSTAFPPPSGPVPEREPAAPVPRPEPPLPPITLGTAHSCPYCGAPVAVVSVLMPVDNPPADGG
jgi:hypothetical protein